MMHKSDESVKKCNTSYRHSSSLNAKKFLLLLGHAVPSFSADVLYSYSIESIKDEINSKP